MKLRSYLAVLAVCAAAGSACGNESTNNGTNPPIDTVVTGDSAASTDDTAAADTAKADTAKADAKADTATNSWKPEKACWVQNCPDEIADCASDQGCIDFADCAALGQANDPDCTDGIDDLSIQMYLAVEKCGYSSCADPNAASCKGQCGSFSNDAPCNCDEACEEYGDCCSDYEQECKAPPADTTGGDTSGDDAAIGQDTTMGDDATTGQDTTMGDVTSDVTMPADTTATGG